VQPRSRKIRSKIGSGIPSSQSRIQPVAPSVCFLIDKCITLISFQGWTGNACVVFKTRIRNNQAAAWSQQISCATRRASSSIGPRVKFGQLVRSPRYWRTHCSRPPQRSHCAMWTRLCKINSRSFQASSEWWVRDRNRYSVCLRWWCRCASTPPPIPDSPGAQSDRPLKLGPGRNPEPRRDARRARALVLMDYRGRERILPALLPIDKRAAINIEMFPDRARPLRVRPARISKTRAKRALLCSFRQRGNLLGSKHD